MTNKAFEIRKKRHLQAIKSFKHEFIETPGTSALIVGQTGSGKTTKLIWLVERFFENGEVVIWRDNAKNNEAGVLGKIAPLRFFVPEECSVTITNPLNEFETVEFSSYDELFKNFTNDVINVINVGAFLDNRIDHLHFWTVFFRELIDRVRSSDNSVATALIFDEFNQVIPSSHITLGTGHIKLISWSSMMVENMRAYQTRVIGAIHGWTKLAKPVRESFPVRIYKQARNIEPDIREARPMITNLKRKQFVYVSPSTIYSEPLNIPNLFIGELCSKIQIKYEGQLPQGWLPHSRFVDGESKKPKTAGEIFNLIRANYLKKPTEQYSTPHRPTMKELAEDFLVHEDTVYNNIRKEREKEPTRIMESNNRLNKS